MRSYRQIDTARTYTGGTSEEYLGKIDWKKRGLVMDTKLYPNAVRCFCAHTLTSAIETMRASVKRAVEPSRCYDYLSFS